MTIIQNIDAGLTDLARELRVRSEVEGMVFGDWTFQVGTDGFDVITPTEATAVDYAAQTLSAPAGGERYLGLVVNSGAAASATVLGEGFVQLDGLADMPLSVSNRWVRTFGSADTKLNGTWIISEYVSDTAVKVFNPLADADDVGPFNWELRQSCLLRPNDKAIDFFGRLDSADATVDGQELGQVGVFARIVRAPTEPSLVGTSFLFAVAHHPAVAKFDLMSVSYHICVQF